MQVTNPVEFKPQACELPNAMLVIRMSWNPFSIDALARRLLPQHPTRLELAKIPQENPDPEEIDWNCSPLEGKLNKLLLILQHLIPLVALTIAQMWSSPTDMVSNGTVSFMYTLFGERFELVLVSQHQNTLPPSRRPQK